MNVCGLWNNRDKRDRDEIVRLQGDIDLQVELAASVEQELKRLDAELQEARNQGEQARGALLRLQGERQSVENQIQEARQKLGSLNARQGQIQARLIERTAQMERDKKALESAGQAQQRAQQEEQEAKQRQQDNLVKLQEVELAHQQLTASLKSRQETLSQGESDRKQLLDQISNSTTEVEKIKARLEIILQAEATLSGYAEGTRHLLEAVRQGRLAGKAGALNHYLETPVELEQAISAALGDFLEAVLLDSDLEDAFQHIEAESGRGALLPTNWLKPILPLRPENFGLNAMIETHAGWIGVASEFVQTTADMRRVVDILLGNVWIVQDRQAARRDLTNNNLAGTNQA